MKKLDKNMWKEQKEPSVFDELYEKAIKIQKLQVKTIDWDKIQLNLSNSDLCSTEIIDEELGDDSSNYWLQDCSTYDIVQFFKEEIEKQLK